MNSKNLDECINLEIVKSEKKRLEIFIGVMLLALVMLIFNIFFFPITISDVFLHEKSMKVGIWIVAGFLFFLVMSRFMVVYIARCNKPLPLPYQLYSITLDSLVPFVWLYFMMKWEENGAFLDSPLVYLFAIIIIVSALHLSFLLSLFNGLLISLAYAMLTSWTFQSLDTSGMMPSNVYYTKALLLLIAGICAGMVAIELKKRIKMSILHQEEKDELEKLFSQQVSKQVAEALRGGLDFSVKAEASVFFLDIRDFTKKVQFMSPEQVNKFQNKFLGPIMECISRHGGFINQVMGDGLMATFATPDNKNHESNALRAALEILNKLEKMNNKEKDQIEVGIGIHSGEVIAGNIGTKERRQYSFSGMPVITAARLEQMTKENHCSLLVSRQFYEKINGVQVRACSLGLKKLKGLDQEIEVIQIVP